MLERPKRSEIAFPILLENVFPIFLVKSTLVMRDMGVARL